MPRDTTDNVRPHPTARRRAAPTPAAPATPADRRPLGRPRLLNPETQQTIVAALRTGATIRDAAALAGLSEQAVHSWRARGQQALEDAGYLPGQSLDADEALAAIPETERAFVEFSWSLASVAAERKVAWLSKVNRANDWRAQAWLLKHYHPEEFGDRLDVGVTIDHAGEDPQAALLARLARLRESAIETEGTETVEDAG